jgi:predicted alpha/beta-fold hydrolase
LSIEIHFPAFEARAPWWGADLQTVRNVVTFKSSDLKAYSATRLELPTPDGDRLQGVFSLPSDADPARPPIILVHGLTGCEDSSYIRASARFFLDAGWPVLRLNMRGAGPSRATCRQHYHGGRSEDLRTTIRELPNEVSALGVVLMAYSLGANQMLKMLGEDSAERGLVRAAISVSAPIDLARSSRRFLRLRNRLYHRWLLARMKVETVAAGAAVNDQERAAIERARTVYQFDDVFVAPRNGFTDADDYYARCSALGFLDDISMPTLLIHAANDPWIPSDTYTAYDWTRNDNLCGLVAPSGGHVGFHGRGYTTPWHDRCALQYLTELGLAGA